MGKGGRPKGSGSKFTWALADEICDQIAKATPLVDVIENLQKAGVSVGYRTVSDWEVAHPEFAADLARARRWGHDRIAADTLRIADTPVMGEETEEGDGPKGAYTKRMFKEMTTHRNMQINTRLRLLAAWDKRYNTSAKSEDDGVDKDTRVVISGGLPE